MSWITASRSGKHAKSGLRNGPAKTAAEESKHFNQGPHVSAPRDTHPHNNPGNPVASAGCPCQTHGTYNTNTSDGIFNQVGGSQYFGGVPIHVTVHSPTRRSDKSTGCWPDLLAEKRLLQAEIIARMDKSGWDEERKLRQEILGLQAICRSLPAISKSMDDEEEGTDGGRKKKRKRGKSGRRRPY